MELQSGHSCQKENDHAISMVLAMIIAFFVCWLPYTALSVVVVVDPELHIPPLVATMPMYFAKTSPVYNPIIYFLSNKQVSSSAAIQVNRWRQNLMPFLALLRSSETPPWRCCPVAATSPAPPPASPSICAALTGRASSRLSTARCRPCDCGSCRGSAEPVNSRALTLLDSGSENQS